MNWGPSLAMGRMNTVTTPTSSTRPSMKTSRVASERRRCSRRSTRSVTGPRMMLSRAATTIQVGTTAPPSRAAGPRRCRTIPMVTAMVRIGTRSRWVGIRGPPRAGRERSVSILADHSQPK